MQHASPWIYRDFLQDGKLRVRERYARMLEPPSSIGRILVLPDAPSWRTCLTLFRQILKEVDTSKENPSWRLVLCESTVEYMDYRNQSSNEAVAPRERITLQQLANDDSIYVLPDLSLRQQDDEWDVLRFPGMSIPDRGTQGLIRAASMLAEHEARTDKVYILSSSKEDSSLLQRLLDDDRVESIDMDGFLRLCLHPEDLERYQELRATCEQDYRVRNENRSANISSTSSGDIDEYLTEEEVRQGLAQGQLVAGKLDVTKDNPAEAYVKTSKGRFFVDVQRHHHNRALHQDLVVIRPLPEVEWGRPVGRRRLVHRINNNDDDPENMRDSTVPFYPSAVVVAVRDVARRNYVATLLDTPKADDHHCLVVPADVRIPKIRLVARKNYLGRRLLIEVDGWNIGSTYPHGRCVQILGPIGELETEIASLLNEFQVKLQPYSVSALSQLPDQANEWRIPAAELERRKDLRRSRRVFSVDPPGCQDIDDTMSCHVLPNGDVEIGVHIADVTHFVPHDSPLDREAQVRGTTFYLVDRRFDMLPSVLSSNLCSLHGQVDRLAVSVLWVFDAKLEKVKSTWFGRTIIHNCAAMTYEQADCILQGLSPETNSYKDPPPLTAGSRVDEKLIPALMEDLTALTILARKQRKKREDKGGAVDLSSGDLGSELKFVVDENGTPVNVAPKQDKEIYHTIAELMILANAAVATRIYEDLPNETLLRIHQHVDEDRFEDLYGVLAAAGDVSFNGSSNRALADTLKKAEAGGSSVVNALYKSMATRAMSEALYVCSGDGRLGNDFSHYGLGLSKYTHFTSPIRRYADVVVHRQLLGVVEDGLVHVRGRQGPSKLAVDRQMLTSLPESQTISIMSGDKVKGLDDAGEDDLNGLWDETIEGAAELTRGPQAAADGVQSAKTQDNPQFYGVKELSRICTGLNLRSRLAKRSSYACQSLFLRLYFRTHTEVTEAVVTSTRINGMRVYVPRFDLHSSVFLMDLDGAVQMDPSIFGLPADSGKPPTLAFSELGSCRRFSLGKTALRGPNEDELVVSVEGKSFSAKPLDVVQVLISSQNWDDRARVPAPHLHLVASGRKLKEGMPNVASAPLKISSSALKEEPVAADEHKEADEDSSNLSIASVLASFPVNSHLLVDLRRRRSMDENLAPPAWSSTLAGRLQVNGFVNPNTRRFHDRRVEQRRGTTPDAFDQQRQAERTAMARTQRLAAEKRNARKAKARKN